MIAFLTFKELENFICAFNDLFLSVEIAEKRKAPRALSSNFSKDSSFNSWAYVRNRHIHVLSFLFIEVVYEPQKD